MEKATIMFIIPKPSEKRNIYWKFNQNSFFFILFQCMFSSSSTSHFWYFWHFWQVDRNCVRLILIWSQGAKCFNVHVGFLLKKIYYSPILYLVGLYSVYYWYLLFYSSINSYSTVIFLMVFYWRFTWTHKHTHTHARSHSCNKNR